MGFLDILLAGPRVEHAKTALVAKYVFDGIRDSHLKEEIIKHAIIYLHENAPIPSTMEESISIFETLHEKVRCIFIAVALTEMGIDHTLDGFYMSFPSNPFTVEFYSDNTWNTAKRIILKNYGISVDIH